MKLTLPIPPSVNDCYGTNFATKRRFKTKRYESWENQAMGEFFQQKRNLQMVEGKVNLHYRIGRAKDKRARDLGNYEKPLSDFLVKCRMIEDDSLVQTIMLEWRDDVPHGRVEIEITKGE